MQLLEVVAHLFHPRRSNNHRPRALHPSSLVSYALLLLGFSGFVFNVGLISKQMGSVLGYSSEITADQVVMMTNTERAKLQLSQLAPNPALTAAAHAKAKDMFANQYWAHISPAGKQPWDFIAEAHYSYTSAGENLAKDFMHGSDMMTAWMNSPTHKANIVNPKYTQIGVAVENGSLQGVETTLVVQLFGRPAAAGAAKPAVPEKAAQTEKVQVSETTTNTPEVAGSQTSPVVEEPTLIPDQQVSQLSDASETATHFGDWPISPLLIFKIVALSIIGLVMGVLTYDAYIMEGRNTIRLVGHNVAHLLYFAVIAGLLLVFKSGAVR